MVVLADWGLSHWEAVDQDSAEDVVGVAGWSFSSFKFLKRCGASYVYLCLDND